MLVIYKGYLFLKPIKNTEIICTLLNVFMYFIAIDCSKKNL